MTRVLVIDDEPDVRYAIRAVLEDRGMAVDEADNGETGLSLFNQGSFDLVICDIIMPLKEGIETITEIRQIKPQQKILAMSGGGRIRKEDYLAVASVIGATMTIAKPFEADTLVELLNRMLTV